MTRIKHRCSSCGKRYTFDRPWHAFRGFEKRQCRCGSVRFRIVRGERTCHCGAWWFPHRDGSCDAGLTYGYGT